MVKRKRNDIPKSLKPYVEKNPYGLGIVKNYRVKTSVRIPPSAERQITKSFRKSRFDGMLYRR